MKRIYGITIFFCSLLLGVLVFTGLKLINLDVLESDNLVYMIYLVGIICVTILLTLLLGMITFSYQSKYKCMSDLISQSPSCRNKEVELHNSQAQKEYNNLAKEVESLKAEIKLLKLK